MVAMNNFQPDDKSGKLLVGLTYDKHLPVDDEALDQAIGEMVVEYSDVHVVQQLLYWMVSLIRRMGAHPGIPFVIQIVDEHGCPLMRATVEHDVKPFPVPE